MTQNRVLRQRAREMLGGNIFAKSWLMLLLVYFIYLAITSFAGSIAIGAVIVAGPFAYGLARVFVRRARGDGEVEIGDMFTGFSECFGQSFLLGLLTGIFVFLWTLLFIIPGFIKAYSYSMAPYIMQDDPTKDWKTCLDESRQMMNGYKWKLFCLDLSFIGWYIVGALCFGIGVLFVYPYHRMAHANFYLDIKGEEVTDAEPEVI